MNLLLLDSSLMIQGLFTELLKESRIRLDIAESCQEAITRLARERYACLVMDSILPDGDGLNVLRIAPHSAEKVFLFTGLPVTEKLRVMAHQLGVAGIYRKEPEQLRKLIDDVTLAIRET